MPMMKSLFDTVLNSTSGHCISAKASVPVWVPPAVVAMATERGMTHEGDAPPLPVVEPEVVAPVETDDNKARLSEVALDQAVTRIIVRNDPEDFKNDLTPKVAKVIAEMDPEFSRPTATQVFDAHARLQENIELAE